MASKRKFKHSDTFKTKADLRDRLDVCERLLADLRTRNENQSRELRILNRDLQRKNHKILSDSFLVDELRKQVAQQHVQLCNVRENTRELRENWQSHALQKQAIWDQEQATAMLARTVGRNVKPDAELEKSIADANS